jgi:drug/metabolite transporter (DMT)-like permease
MVAVMAGSTGGGLLLAAGAAICFETGYAFQALEARRAPAALALRIALLGHLARNARWIGATALSILGWPLQVAALAMAPLAVVQPTLALGLLLLLVLGVRVLGERVGRREVAAVALVIAGIAVLAASAPPPGHAPRGPGIVIALALLAAVGVAPHVARRRSTPALAIVATGAADSVAALGAKLVAEQLSAGHWPAVAALVALAGCAGLLATISEMSALQQRPATQVAPIVLAIQIAVPVVVAGLVGGERWSATPLGGVTLAAGIAAVVAGAALLASSPAVAGIIGVPAREPPTPPS